MKYEFKKNVAPLQPAFFSFAENESCSLTTPAIARLKWIRIAVTVLYKLMFQLHIQLQQMALITIIINNRFSFLVSSLLLSLSPQDWFSRQQLILLVLIVNIALAIMFFKMLT